MSKVYVAVNHGSSLLKDLHQQFKEGKNCDLEIRLNGKRLYVHKCLIDIFFMKVGAEIEDDRFYLDLTQYSQHVVETLVGFIYTGSLCCSLDKIEAVYVASLELGCVEAQKGCKMYLQNPDMFSGGTSNSSYDSLLGNQVIDQSASESVSETESFNAGEQPPEVKIEVVDDTYYQYTDLPKANDGYVHKRKVTDYASTIAIPQLPVEEGDLYPSTDSNGPTAACNEKRRSTDHPRTIAIPIGMHSTPEDLKLIEKRRGRPPVSVLTSTALKKAVSSKSKSTDTKEEKGIRGRRCKNHGTTVEYVYPKKPVIQRKKWQRNNLVSLLSNKTVLGEMKAGKDVIDGLRIRLQPNKDEVDGNKGAGKRKAKPGVKKQNKQKKDNSASEYESRSANDSDIEDVNATHNDDTCEEENDTDVISVETENKTDITSSRDLDSEEEKNEQMLFLGLTKTIDEDTRKLEEKSGPKANTRRLRSRKRVNYGKDDSADLDELDEMLAPTCKKVAKKLKTTAVGDDVIDDIYTSKGKKPAYASTIAMKKGTDDDVEDRMYFPPAGVVPQGTRSRYAQGSFMETKFVTESIQDRSGNITVISKRVPVRPRQFGLDERLKNRPAIYICHPTAPVINPNNRAPTKLTHK